MVRKHPALTLAVIVTLALGIGVNTAVFSVVNAIVLRPLPVRDGDRLVVVATQRASSQTLKGVSFPDLQDYRAAAADVLEDIAGYSVGFLGLSSAGGQPDRVLVTWVTGNYFPLLDIRPTLGRLIRSDEGGSGRTDSVVVLGHSAWQRRFDGDPSVVGRIVRVNGISCTIVGVAPPGFSGTFAFSDSELYLPLNWQSDQGLAARESRGLHAIARLRSTVSLEHADAVMKVVATRLASEYPDSNTNVDVKVIPERLARPEEDQSRTNRIGAAIMLAMAILVMVIAAVNVTNLMLARTASRYGEMAIRAALGAGRGRLVRQMVTESLVLTALGGAVGVASGVWLANALTTIRLPGDLPVRFDFRLDGRVLAYAATVSVLAGLVVGVLSAIRVSGTDLDRVLRGSRPASPGNRHRIRGILVVGQIACCFILLSVAGLFARSLFHAERADLGFRPDGILNLQMDVGQLGYTETRGRAFFAEVERRVRAIPGVEHVSFAFTIPMGYVRVGSSVEAEGQPADRGSPLIAGTNMVSAEYFQTMGIQLVRGRDFNDGDGEQSRSVAVINQHLADVLWPNQDALGRRVRSDGQLIEVVGVARTGKYQYLFEDPQPYVYLPIAQAYTGLRALQVRSSVSSDELEPAVRRAIGVLEHNLPLYDVQPMAQALGSGLGFFPVRVAAMAACAFGLLALALAIVGLYGVTSYLTSQRTHEIGIRLAVGATRPQIVRLVVQDGAKLVMLGLAAGVLATFACTGVVGRYLFEVSASDPMTLVSVAGILAGVALIACAIPARRAGRVDPVNALRAE